MAGSNCYAKGKSTGHTKVSAAMGKMPNSSGTKVSYNAGKSSGTKRDGASSHGKG